MREGIVAGLTSRNYRRAVESVVDGYGIEKSSVSRKFVAASAAQLQELCEKKLGDLDLVAILIDGIHFGQQVLVVALGIATSGQKHVLGVWQGATENTAVVKDLLGRPGGARAKPGATLLVCDRWGQGPARRHRAGVRQSCRSATLPVAQTA
ncbi:MAG TPA: transposase, partial [Terriglobia bacterium]|nr:transposase [Terriglobia bacterium]